MIVRPCLVRTWLCLSLLLLGLSGCSGKPEPLKSAAGMETFVPGTGSVRLGMTEQELIDTFGVEPEKRESSPENRTEVLVFKVPAQQEGQSDGYATAVFLGGPLVRIAFERAPESLLRDVPNIDVQVGESLARYKLAMKLIRNEMTMEQVESHAGGPGRLATWTLLQNGANSDQVRTQWLWQLEGTEKILILEAWDGVPQQPMLRDRSTISPEVGEDAK